MLHWNALKQLDYHQSFLQKRIHKSELFLVGGCIRDLLLGLTDNPLDIDFTCGGNPESLYSQINTDGLSFFKTDKFGTITLIPPKEKERSYQLTPLRTEGNYEDFRHPGEINRSNNIILDAKRRDFSINAIYYFSTKQTTKKSLDFSTSNPKEITDNDIIQVLNKTGYCYISNINLLILRDSQYIEQIFPQSNFDEYCLRYLIEIQPECYIICQGDERTQKKGINKSEKLFRIIIDPEGGIDSLINRKLTTVGNPDQRFGEDALRLIRGIRIVNICNHQLLNQNKSQTHAKPQKKGNHNPSKGLQNKAELFDFSTETRNSIKKNAHLLGYVAKERIKEELCKAFQKGNPFAFIILLDACNLLPILFPSLAKTKFVDQPIRYHAFDIYTHIMLSLKALQQINSDYLVRFSMLYHDVGKVEQYAAYEKANTKEERQAIFSGSINHRESSPILMRSDFSALGFSKKEIETIERYIHEHHTPGEILKSNPCNWTKKIRKLLSEKGYYMVNNLFDINIADRIGQENPLQNSSDLSDSYYLKDILQEINNSEGQFEMKDLATNGEKLMKHFNLTPSPIIGELLHQAFDRVLTDISKRNTEKEIYNYLENYIKNRPSHE